MSGDIFHSGLINKLLRENMHVTCCHLMKFKNLSIFLIWTFGQILFPLIIHLFSFLFSPLVYHELHIRKSIITNVTGFVKTQRNDGRTEIQFIA